MTKFAISSEGVESLRKLAQDLRDLMEHALSCGRTLQNVMLGLSNELGSFSDESLMLASDSVAVVAKASAFVTDMAQALDSKAANIEGMLPVGDVRFGSSVSLADGFSQNQMRPSVGAVPRSLSSSQYGWTMQNGKSVYDHPAEVSRYLYIDQGSAYPANFQGTCGLCSCANVLRLSGVQLGEKEMVDFAASNKLCDYVPGIASSSGGTGPDDRRRILDYFGVPSDVVAVGMSGGVADGETIGRLARFVSEGRGVIVSVHANTLHCSGRAEDDYHAVTVTSVVRDKFGRIDGFYICDSNVGTTYYSADLVRRALTGNAMNVTKTIIR